MSHTMAQRAGIGAHGLCSISRGLTRGVYTLVPSRLPRSGNFYDESLLIGV